MNADRWTPLDDSERDGWGYVPRRTVGPLGFGMAPADAVAAMAGCGFTAEQRNIGAWQATHRSQWRVAFDRPGVRRGRWPAVTCYFVDGVGLTCVLVRRPGRAAGHP
ncbi:hypothetical protein [Streptomyces sp. NRRL B-24484]|uniref:hypothetical protein n=1 Tax=Streptomyces sp. NRRL B-24484 TaxID=1463833 RepID=UPI000AF71B0D|nr:hypothetical protein [Streptomyces sp. NRRL B-24484]